MPLEALEDDDLRDRSARSSQAAYDYDSQAPDSARDGDDLETNFVDMKDNSAFDLPLEPLSENIYGFIMASLIKDSADMKVHPEHCLHSLRPLRICGAFLLCLVMFGLQGFFVVEAKALVTPHDVAVTRRVYGTYEAVMYVDDSNVSHTWKTSNGYSRGITGYFNISNFAMLSQKDKELVCRVPLSQPQFLFGVLFIWALTVLNHMRMTLNLFLRIVYLPRLETMDGAVRTHADGTDEVVGLTLLMKCTLVLFVQCPRVIMNSILLWLGARWLTATLGFGDLLLNALALEFILNLSYLLYNTMVPYSGKLLVQKTFIPHMHKKEYEHCCNMFGMFSCGFIAVAMCVAYMFWLQAVLPSYKWDVHRACKIFLKQELSV